MRAATLKLRLPAPWRRPVLVGISFVAHVVVLGVLASGTFHLKPAPAAPPLIWVDIEPRPLLPNETPRPRPAAAAASARQLETARDLAGNASLALRDPRRDDEEDENAPTPRMAQNPGAGQPGTEDPWRYRPESMAGAIGRSLRTSPIGCDMRDGRMTAAEQQLCDERFNARAGVARPITGTDNPERDARFAREGAQALAQYERRRRPLAGGTGVVGPADCVGSNFGTGCAGSHIDPSLSPESTTNIRTDRRDGPR